jgi:hypothetical protein
VLHQHVCLLRCAVLLPQIHQAMAAACRGAFCHSVADVEEAAWHLVCEVAGASEAEADRAVLLELLAPVAMRLPITTPGAPFTKVGLGAWGAVFCSGLPPVVMLCAHTPCCVLLCLLMGRCMRRVQQEGWDSSACGALLLAAWAVRTTAAMTHCNLYVPSCGHTSPNRTPLDWVAVCCLVAACR